MQPSSPATDTATLLKRAVKETARLLNVEGAIVYLVDPADGVLRFEVDAGIRNREARKLIRDLTMPVGTGVFGTAVQRREPVVTGDYAADARFRHSPVADRIVTIVSMRSMAAAPLIADDRVLGALGAYSSEVDHFGEADVALVRALADHAATAIANLELIEQLNRSKQELARRVEAQQTLQQIAARIAIIREPDEVLQTIVNAATRLLGSDGAHLTLLDAEAGVLRPTVVAGGTDEEMSRFLATQEFPLDGGMNGLAASNDEVTWTHDYVVDPRIPHEPDDQEVAGRMGLRGMAVAPLRGPEGEIIGTLAVSFEEPHAFGDDELTLLQGLADQGAIAITNARLADDVRRSEASLRRQTDELARRVEAQRTLAEMAAELTALRDPSAVLKQTLKEAVRLLGGAGGQIGMIDADPDGVLRWGVGHSFAGEKLVAFTKEDRSPVDEGVSGRSVRQRRATWTDDYLADESFPHAESADQIARDLGIRAVIAAPLLGDEGPIGAIGVYANQAGAFDDDDAELLQLLANQATIVLSNARLYREGNEWATALSRRVEVLRTLAAIAQEITSLRNPAAVLRRTIDEARRLLDADLLVINQLRGGEDVLSDYREALGAEMPSVDDVTIVSGQGVAGLAVAEGRVAWTGEYLEDRGFQHLDTSDAWIRERGFRSQISAPLVGESGPMGVLTAYSKRRQAFNDEQADVIGALASHASIVLGNTRLYQELEHRVEAQRALGDIAARITAIRDPGDVLQQTLDEAVRLLDADGGRIELVGDDGVLAWAFGHSAIDLPIERETGGGSELRSAGISGKAVAEGRIIVTGDYLTDTSFEHSEASDRYIRQTGIRSGMVAPLIGEQGVIGAITVHSQARDAFDAENAALLEVLAAQAAIAVTNARLYEQLREQSEALARQIDAQRRLLEINERLLSTLEPGDVLETIAVGLKKVVAYDNLGIYRIDDDEQLLRPVLARDRDAEAVLGFEIPRGQGLTWWAVEHREPVLINDALSDPRVIQIPGTPLDPEAIIIVPLVVRDEVVGALNVGRVGGPEVAFSEVDFEIAQLFATQAAIAITNARLYEALRSRVDAQRSLAEIAAAISALRDPGEILQRTVDDTARLLGAEGASINLVQGEDQPMRWAYGHGPMGVPGHDPVDRAAVLRPGEGIGGTAIAERRVVWTGDYLKDDSFVHVDTSDRWATQHGLMSAMSAPMLGESDALGTLNVYSPRRQAFGAEDAELLGALASQAAIAVTNARLYAELGESERRYRHLVDNSPDIVWSVDAEGRFTFLSDSLESRTGWRPEQLLGKPFTVMADAGSLEAATVAWEQLRSRPGEEQRVRLDLPLADGQISQAEVAMTGTVVDGRFAGAHGSVRDISERERLEGDLRRQAAELAASNERAHLARELHDSVTQALFSMGLTMRSLEILLDTDTDSARGKLVELRELQKDALAEMRQLIFELRPASLEHDGLLQALRTHAAAVQGRTGLSVSVDCDLPDRLPLDVEEALYRIGQEALHNVVKHANAEKAEIRLTHDARRVRMTVEDDGSGFSPDEVPRGHLGLIGMQQRADLVGADLRVRSRIGQGTTIEVLLPVGAAEPVAVIVGGSAE